MSEHRIIDYSGRDITDEFNLSCENGATLRDALDAHHLRRSGTKREKARRLLAAGVTHEHVRERHDWQARSDAARIPCKPEAGA